MPKCGVGFVSVPGMVVFVWEGIYFIFGYLDAEGVCQMSKPVP